MPQIPQSQALSEASQGDSLAELLSRDPEGYSKQDLSRVIDSMREMREKLSLAEASGVKPRTARMKEEAAPIMKKAEDLGL